MKIEVIQWSSDRTFKLLFDFTKYNKKTSKYYKSVIGPWGYLDYEVVTSTITDMITTLNCRRISYISQEYSLKRKPQHIYTVWVIKD